jgi:predicted amidohydrolase
MKIAAIQMCSSDKVNENLATAKKLIIEAVKGDAKLIVLPEMFAIMGKHDQDKLAIKEDLGHGEIQGFLAEQAKAHQVWIVGGTIPIACADKNKVRAACLMYNPQGMMIARYDKIHLFDISLSEKDTYKESQTTEPGNKLVVIDTPFGKIGLAVCYDIRFPEMFRALCNKGAEIILIPTAFTAKTGEAHWELLTRSRAVDGFCYVVGACQGGTHANGRQTYGNSMIVEPWGSIIAKLAGTESGVIYSNIDLEHLRTIRKSIPIFEHQKDFSKIQVEEIIARK